MSYFHFDTREVPEGERRKSLEEIYSPMCGLDIEIQGRRTDVDVKVKAFPSLAISDAHLSKHRAYRSYQHVADGDDSMLLIIPRRGHVGINHRRRDCFTCTPGELHMVPVDRPFISYGFDRLNVATISLPCSWVETRLLRAGEWIGRTNSPANSGALNLFIGYLDSVFAMRDELSEKSEQLVEQHLLDLLCLVLGVNDSDTKVAQGRGARYARLQMMRQHVRKHMIDSALTAESVAGHFGISAQYVRKIFHESGTTFSDYLNGVRLEWVFDQLSGGKLANSQIATLAYEVGFNNLAWFNRSFRNRFDMTPSEVRDLVFAQQLR